MIKVIISCSATQNNNAVTLQKCYLLGKILCDVTKIAISCQYYKQI